MNWFTKLFRRKPKATDDGVKDYCARRGCKAGETHCDGFCHGVEPDGAPMRDEYRRQALQMPPFPCAPSPAPGRVVSMRGSSFSKTREVRSSPALSAPYGSADGPTAVDYYLAVAAAASAFRDTEPAPPPPTPNYESGGGGDYGGGGASGSWSNDSSPPSID